MGMHAVMLSSWTWRTWFVEKYNPTDEFSNPMRTHLGTTSPSEQLWLSRKTGNEYAGLYPTTHYGSAEAIHELVPTPPLLWCRV